MDKTKPIKWPAKTKEIYERYVASLKTYVAENPQAKIYFEDFKKENYQGLNFKVTDDDVIEFLSIYVFMRPINEALFPKSYYDNKITLSCKTFFDKIGGDDFGGK